MRRWCSPTTSPSLPSSALQPCLRARAAGLVRGVAWVARWVVYRDQFLSSLPQPSSPAAHSSYTAQGPQEPPAYAPPQPAQQVPLPQPPILAVQVLAVPVYLKVI